MEFRQLIEHNMMNFFIKNNAENGAGRLATNLFLVF